MQRRALSSNLLSILQHAVHCSRIGAESLQWWQWRPSHIHWRRLCLCHWRSLLWWSDVWRKSVDFCVCQVGACLIFLAGFEYIFVSDIEHFPGWQVNSPGYSSKSAAPSVPNPSLSPASWLVKDNGSGVSKPIFKILVPIMKQISWIFRNSPNFRILVD